MSLTWLLHPTDHSHNLRLVLISWLQERRVDLRNIGISHQPERNLQPSEQNNFVDLSEEKNDPKPKVDAIQILNDSSEEIEEIDPVALAKINITDEALLQVSLLPLNCYIKS